jgi:hypothetical protein
VIPAVHQGLLSRSWGRGGKSQAVQLTAKSADSTLQHPHQAKVVLARDPENLKDTPVGRESGVTHQEHDDVPGLDANL